MTRRAEWIFARAALLILSVVALVTWLSFLPGCSVDYQALSEPIAPLARGAVDTGVTEVVTPQDVAGIDANSSGAPDVLGSTPTDGGGSDLVGTGILPDSEQLLPPSECPISATRSLSLCDATSQLCRYYDTGAPILMTGCTAEGRLCVKVCL